MQQTTLKARGWRAFFRTGAVAGLALLSACGAELSQSFVHRSGVPSAFNYGAGGRDLRTVVLGNPFAMPKVVIDEAVIDSIQGMNNGPVTHFTIAPSNDARAPYRVVILFDPPKTLAWRDLCGNAAALESVARDARLRVSIAFCVNEPLYAHVDSSIPSADSPDDPAFRKMMGRATFLLIPPRDPTTAGDDACEAPTVCP
ncbi:MAG: hypothetical protein QF902_07720 [Rhodospirillales bacterium]|jgi:hypothetical protein|nr:hypothetical protein [Rhodospirillales bacterium]